MKHPLVAFAVLLFSLMLPCQARSEWYSYTSADGLAHENIETILADRVGNLWFGGGGGVTRYDGVTWQTYGSVGFENALQVKEMTEDRSGNIWFVRYNDPPCCFDGAAWREYTTQDGLASDDVTTVFGDSKGNVWFGTGVGLSRYDGTTWRTFTTADGLGDGIVFAITEDHSGNLWVVTQYAMCRYDGVNWQTYPIDVRLGYYGASDVLVDRGGNVWLSTSDGVGRLFAGHWTVYTTANGLASNRVEDIAEDRYGNLWFATFDQGVSRFDRVSWRTYTTLDGLVSNYVRTITEDHAGNLWFGTYYNVSRYDGASWRTYTTADGLADNEVGAGFEDRSGNLWFACSGNGVSRYDGTSWRTYTTADGLSGNAVWAMIQDRNGGFWFGTDSGATRYDGASWLTYTFDDNPYENVVTAIVEDRFGNLWFGTQGAGVSRFDGVTWKKYSTLDGLVDMTVSHILEDHSGDLWFGTYHGISRFDGVTWRTYTPPDIPPSSMRVTAMFEDRHGNLWFGLYGGLYKFDGTNWSKYTQADGLLDNEIYAVAEDRNGYLWFGNRNGVSRYDGVSFGAYSSLGGVASYAVDDIFQDRFQRLWFCTHNGVIAHEVDLVAPITVISPMVPRLSTSTTHTVGYTAAYREIAGVTFSYSFDGSSWSAWSPTNFWLGTDLSEGEHTFRVRARDAIGNIDSTGAVAAFEIDATPPTPMITSPASGQAVRDSVAIAGTASDNRFGQYRVEARMSGAATWDLLTQSVIPVTEGFLCGWNTLLLPEGPHELRVSVTDTLGLTGNALVRVVIDNQAPWAYETAPAEVKGTTGGDIYTTDARVHLYFPPRAFGEDVVVDIVTLPDSLAPVALPNGAVRMWAGCEISWGDVSLQKSATLEMAYTGTELSSGTVCLYACHSDSTWHRVGGTVDEQTAASSGKGVSGGASSSGTASRISAAITEPGRHALFLEAPGTSGTGASSLSALSLTPRVFSSNGTFANDHVAIGFTLGRSAPVSVKVYNRAGRLVRELVSGETMGAGANLVRWDGRDGDANLAGDGLYLIVVDALGQKQSKTIAVVK